MTTYNVAVYGSLRKGLHNHRVMGSSKLLSVEEVEGFKLYSLGAFPAVERTGSSSLVVEVYEVDVPTLARLNVLEGTTNPDGRDPRNFYNRETVETSVGEAFIYEGNMNLEGRHVVDGGDWFKYIRGGVNA